eukprot:c33710_g1_i1.p1 GENE.c33710_g1_i1~~c33710_g1_i1.p1  ORF type:complete len:395 (+),score=64.05 c33710_g1_i1:38-1186(+)
MSDNKVTTRSQTQHAQTTKRPTKTAQKAALSEVKSSVSPPKSPKQTKPTKPAPKAQSPPVPSSQDDTSDNEATSIVSNEEATRSKGNSTAARPLHVKALMPHPSYPARFEVPLDKVDWNEPFEGYKPVEFTHGSVTANNRKVKKGGWADPPLTEMNDEELADLRKRLTYCGDSLHFEGNAPINPIGRTGISGRGLLGNWGPNFAADPIVTRRNLETGGLEMVAIQRVDTQEWAIPGGMVDAGECVSATLKREFGEEAMSTAGLTPEELEEWKIHLDQLFHSGTEIYRGYVDDPRNTDNSWMETTAVWFRADDELGEKLRLVAATDAANVRWLSLDDQDAISRLYASHAEFVNKVIELARATPSNAKKPQHHQLPTRQTRSKK